MKLADKKRARESDERVLYADATAYPALYRKTYWGNFELGKNSLIPDVIVENRNAFAEEHGGKKLKFIDSGPARVRRIAFGGKYPGRCLSDVDHVEIYRAPDGAYLVVVSPYVETKPEAEHVAHYASTLPGFTKLPPMYATNARTMMRRITRADPVPPRPQKMQTWRY